MRLRKNYNLFLFYGIFLIVCGILTVTFLGFKAKTGLLSGSICGTIAIALAYWMRGGRKIAYFGGLAYGIIMLGIFAWRGGVTFMKLVSMISVVHEDMRIKAAGFLIIAMMFTATLILTMIHVFHFPIHMTEDDHAKTLTY